VDSHNLFDTPVTYRIIRAEYLAGLATAVTLAVIHWHDIRWVPFVVLFFYIDLIGYVPGAIAARRSRDGYIHKGFYVLYNTMHTLLTAGLVAGVYSLVFGPEWALLALPIHLFTDRGVIGNQMKSFGMRFEPSENPVYYAIRPLLDRPRQPYRHSPVLPVVVPEPTRAAARSVDAPAGSPDPLTRIGG
jgi:hypothetical protein